MEQIKLKASLREGKGKQAVKKLRAQGLVPGVVYHRGEEPVSITVVDKEISKIIHSEGGENILINLTIDKEGAPASGGKSRAVIIKELQHHPVKRSILHIDFNEISMTEKIIIEVEVVGQGESVGVKQEGGVLDHPLRQLKIQCLPVDIPKHIDVDISGLKIGQSIHVKDLVLSDKIKVLTDLELVLFAVKMPVEEKVEETAAEPQEVEVMRERKEEEPKAGAEKAKEEPKAKEAAKPEKK